MKLVKSMDKLKRGDVVMVVGYDNYSFASGDADGWFSEIYSVDEVGSDQAPAKLVKPEGGPPPDRNVEKGYEELWGNFTIGGDYGNDVAVFLLQRGRMSDDVDNDNYIDRLLKQQTLEFEGELE